MKFRIEEKIHELIDGYFTLIIKYSVVFCLAWMLGILIVYTYPCMVWNGDKYPPALIFVNNYDVVNWILAIAAILYYSKRKFKHYQLGLIIEMNFENNNFIQLEIINTLNGKLHGITLTKEDFKLIKEDKNSSFFGKQSVYHFYRKGKLLTNLNIEMTAWKRHSDVKNMLAKLDSFL
ncbi:MAG: hypothetical protein HYR91_09935 [Flavobacteriia bacterium]|nr:hypothetical protein [Flavobacteriia bacterium]